ncbi:RNA polymerase sigma factor [candidate division KSB1 bacterium]
MPEKTKDYFVDMVFKHIAIIYKICNMYAEESEKNDLQQEIIYQLWKSFPSYRGDAKFQTWMYRIALNTALLGLRAKKIKYTEISENEMNIPYEPGSENDRNIKVKQLYYHISKLNDLDKAIIFLYLEKCSYEEISEITGMNKKNISVRLVRIREKLRKMFNNKSS